MMLRMRMEFAKRGRKGKRKQPKRPKMKVKGRWRYR